MSIIDFFFSSAEGLASGTESRTEETMSRRLMQRQLQNIEWFATRFAVFLVACILSFGAAVHEHSSVSDKGKSLYVIAVFLAVAAVGIVGGGILGFIFGIPRFLRQSEEKVVTPKKGGAAAPDGTQDAAKASAREGLRSFAGNTNLEEISDWLTKIFVGIGLVQANNIYDGLSILTNNFSANAMPNVPAAGVFFDAVALSSSIGGFLFFYLETRTRITLLLTDADMAAAPLASEDSRIVSEVLSTPIRSLDAKPIAQHGSGTSTPKTVDKTTPADRQLLTVPFENLNTPEAFAAWAGAQARASNIQAAIRSIQEAISREPDNSQYLRMLADIRLNQGNAQDAINAYAEAREKNPKDPNLLRQELLAALYLPQPESFRHAFKVADRLAAVQPMTAQDPIVLVWRAAAHGQEFAWLERNNGSDDDKRRSKAAALALAKDIVRLQPDPNGQARRLLRTIFDPDLGGADSGNDDLHVFFGDQEFKDVIMGGS